MTDVLAGPHRAALLSLGVAQQSEQNISVQGLCAPLPKTTAQLLLLRGPLLLTTLPLQREIGPPQTCLAP